MLTIRLQILVFYASIPSSPRAVVLKMFKERKKDVDDGSSLAGTLSSIGCAVLPVGPTLSHLLHTVTPLYYLAVTFAHGVLTHF